MTNEEKIIELEKEIKELSDQLRLTIKLIDRVAAAVNCNSSALLEILSVLKSNNKFDPNARI